VPHNCWRRMGLTPLKCIARLRPTCSRRDANVMILSPFRMMSIRTIHARRRRKEASPTDKSTNWWNTYTWYIQYRIRIWENCRTRMMLVNCTFTMFQFVSQHFTEKNTLNLLIPRAIYEYLVWFLDIQLVENLFYSVEIVIAVCVGADRLNCFETSPYRSASSTSVNSESFNQRVSHFIVIWWHLFSYPSSHWVNVEQTPFVLPIHITLIYLRSTLPAC
jgi:hypothetical protein